MRPGAILGAALLIAPLPLAAQDLDLSHGGPIDITASDGLEWRQHEQQVIARGNAKAIRDNVTVTADRLIAWYRKKPADATTPGEAGKTAASPPGAAGGQTNAGGPAAGQAGAQPGAQPGAQAQANPAQTGAAGTQTAGGRPAAGQAATGAQAGDRTAQAGNGGQGLLADSDSGGNEIYRVQAEGNVHIYTQTDQAQGDKATYDLDQAVMVMTGRNLKLTTPSQVMTARDDMEYWAQKHMAVARGDAVVVTNDGRRLSADTVVAYTVPTNNQPEAGTKQPKPGANSAGTGTKPAEAATKPPAAGADQPATGAKSPETSAPQVATKTEAHGTSTGTPTGTTPGKADAKGSPAADDPLGASGKLEKVEVYGNVVIRTVTDTVTGDRAVYVPDTGIARVAGKVRITRGQNQLAGAEAEVNLKTGISRLLPSKGSRVSGLVVPNDQTNQAISGTPGQPPAAPKGPSAPPASTLPPPNPISIAPVAGKPK